MGSGSPSTGIPCGAPVVNGPAGIPPTSYKAFEAIDNGTSPPSYRPAGSIVVSRDGTAAWVAAGQSGSPPVTTWLPFANVEQAVSFVINNWGNLNWLNNYTGDLSVIHDDFLTGRFPALTCYCGQPSGAAQYDYFAFALSVTELLYVEVKKDDTYVQTEGRFTLDISDLSDGDGVPSTIQTRLKTVVEANSPIRMSGDSGGNPDVAFYVLTSGEGPDDQTNAASFTPEGTTWSVTSWGVGSTPLDVGMWPYGVLNATLPRVLYDAAFELSSGSAGPPADDLTAGGFTLTFIDTTSEVIATFNYTAAMLKADADTAGYGGDSGSTAPFASAELAAFLASEVAGTNVGEVQIAQTGAAWAFGADSFVAAASSVSFTVGGVPVGSPNLTTGTTTDVSWLDIADVSTSTVGFSFAAEDTGGTIQTFQGLDPRKEYVLEITLDPPSSGPSGQCDVAVFPQGAPTSCGMVIQGFQPSNLVAENGTMQVAYTPNSGLLLARQVAGQATGGKGTLSRQLLPAGDFPQVSTWEATMGWGTLPLTTDTVFLPMRVSGGTSTVFNYLELVASHSCAGWIRLTERP